MYNGKKKKMNKNHVTKWVGRCSRHMETACVYMLSDADDTERSGTNGRKSGCNDLKNPLDVLTT
jgi:hypothetical protein